MAKTLNLFPGRRGTPQPSTARPAISRFTPLRPRQSRHRPTSNKLPFSIKVLPRKMLRNLPDNFESPSRTSPPCPRSPAGNPVNRVPVKVDRVSLQDFTGRPPASLTSLPMRPRPCSGQARTRTEDQPPGSPVALVIDQLRPGEELRQPGAMLTQTRKEFERKTAKIRILTRTPGSKKPQ